MNLVKDNPALSKVFGLFRDYQKCGQFSRLLLETRCGDLTAHLSVQCSVPAPRMERTRTMETRNPRRKTPSRRRRNEARREAWLAKKQAKNPVSSVNVNQDEESILEKTEVVEKSNDKAIDLKILAGDKSTQLVELVKGSVIQINNPDNMIVQIDGQTEEEEWTPPEFIDCIKIDMDEFKNAETAESKIRTMLDEYDIEIKRLKIVNNSQNQFRNEFFIEIEEYKYTTLNDLEESLRKDDKGIKLEIMYNKTIENSTEYF